MRSNFAKWETNVAARLTSMSLCDSGLQKSQQRRQRANAKASKSVARKTNPTVDRLLRRRCQKVCAEGALYANALRTTLSTYINSRTLAAATVILIRLQLGVPP